jgi:superfamily II DNA or RNA helicase
MIDFHEGTLRLRGLTLGQVRERYPGIPIDFDDRDHCFRCDAMWAHAIKPDLATNQFIAIPDKRRIQLRSDQLEAVNAFQTGGHRGLVSMPTGTGKTVVAIELMLRQQSSVLIVVPVRDLMYQWHQKVSEATGIDSGLIGDGVHRVSPISITTYDSAAIHMPRIGDKFSMVIFDEVHHLSGVWRSDAARMSAATNRLGLTATLPTDLGRLFVLQQIVGPVLYQQSMDQAAGNTLAEYTVQRITVQLSVNEEKRYRELGRIVQDYVFERREADPKFRWEDIYKITALAAKDADQAAAATKAIQAFRSKRKIEEQADAKMRLLEDLFRLHSGEPVIVFTGSNVMARSISKRFMVPCLLSHCAKRERREYLEGFAKGDYPVLIANRVLDEGVDLPEVKTAIVLGGLSSSRQAIQRLGRVLRKSETDREAILYEVVTEGTSEVKRSRDRRRNDSYRRPKTSRNAAQ